MNRQSALYLILLLFSATVTGCLKDQCDETRTFIRFDPVYVSQVELDEPIEVEAPRQMINPGIIYFYKDYILVSEFREGIHLINNEDPDNPMNEAFYRIQGSEHFAVISNQLQVNKFNSLITVDISDPQNPVEKFRVHNAFDEIWEDPSRGYLVYYRETEETQVLDCSNPNFNSLRWSNVDRGGPIWIDLAVSERFDQANVSSTGSAVDQGSNSGVGGSTARFTIAANHLYTVSDWNMKVFDLEDPCRPSLVNTVQVGWGIETIYPFKDRLFIGSNAGMFVYDISDPVSPRFLTSFEHARACDPVVADDDRAFVTLRDGTRCEGFNNQLDVIDISNITSPHLIKTYAMDHPHGLSLHDDVLYICEGKYGLKVFDASDSDQMKQIDHRKDLHAYDVIALSDSHILVIGRDGLYQFDASDPARLEVISVIPVVQT
ncbi:MAG: hypothetical protein OEQ53_22460 [Saprospiraceae bacterium]|nr:hypothetical protein [Saprospiraceae bacterium]